MKNGFEGSLVGNGRLREEIQGDADNPNERNSGVALGSDADKHKLVRAWRFWHPEGRYIIST